MNSKAVDKSLFPARLPPITRKRPRIRIRQMHRNVVFHSPMPFFVVFFVLFYLNGFSSSAGLVLGHIPSSRVSAGKMSVESIHNDAPGELTSTRILNNNNNNANENPIHPTDLISDTASTSTITTMTNATASSTIIFHNDATPKKDKYKTVKITVASFLITVAGLSILGWIYLAILRIQYHQEAKREAKQQDRMKQEPQQHSQDHHHRRLGRKMTSSKMPDEEEGGGAGVGMGVTRDGSFEGQFGAHISPSSYRKRKDKRNDREHLDHTDTDSFTKELEQAAIQDEQTWNVRLEEKKRMISKTARMMQVQQEQNQLQQKQQYPQSSLVNEEDDRYISSPRWKDVSSTSPILHNKFNEKDPTISSSPPTFTMSPGDYYSNPFHSSPGDVSTTRHSESASSTTASYAGKYSSTEEDDQGNNREFYYSPKDAFSQVEKNMHPGSDMNQYLLKPMQNSTYNQDDDSFSHTMSLGSGTSTSLGIPSVSASTIDRDPTLHGFYVIDEEKDGMDQYIPQDEYDAAVLAAAATLRNSPRLASVPIVGLSDGFDDVEDVNEVPLKNRRPSFDMEPLMLPQESSSIPDPLVPYKLTKTTQLVPSGEVQSSQLSRNIRPLSRSPTFSLNESLESSTTGGGTGISTGESSHGSKAIYKELSNVSAFLKTYEKKKSIKKKKKKNSKKFKVFLSGRIPEMAELEDLSVDTSTFDGSNQAPVSLPSLSSKSIADTTSGEASSKFMRFKSLGKQKNGYISEKELQTMEVKIKPKGKKSRLLNHRELPPKHDGLVSPRPQNLEYSTYPAIGLSPSADSAASERRFLTTEIESFFSQKDNAFLEGVEVSPKNFAGRMVERRSRFTDLNSTDVNQDDDRGSNVRLGAAPFNPRETNIGTGAKGFMDQFSISTKTGSKGSSSYKIAAVQQPVGLNTIDMDKRLKVSPIVEPSTSQPRSSPPYSANRSSLSPRLDISMESMQRSFSNEPKIAYRDIIDELPAPSSVRESGLRARKAGSPSNVSQKPLIEMGFPRRMSPPRNSPTPPPSTNSAPLTSSPLTQSAENIIETSNVSQKPQIEMGFPRRMSPPRNSPPPPPSTNSAPLTSSPLTQSAKYIIETGAKGIASIVERSRNHAQSPKNVSASNPSAALNTNNSTHAKFSPSSKDTAPVFASNGTVKNTTAQLEAKLQNGAKSIMSIFGNNTSDGKSLDGGGSQSSEKKISDRISSRLNQIRENVKEYNNINYVEEFKTRTSQVGSSDDRIVTKSTLSNWKSRTGDQNDLSKPMQHRPIDMNADAISMSAIPSKIATLRSSFEPSEEVVSPNQSLRNPGKLLKPEVSRMYGDDRYSGRFISKQRSGDSPPKESAIQKSSSGTRNSLLYPKNQDPNKSFHGTRDIISMFESKALSNSKNTSSK